MKFLSIRWKISGILVFSNLILGIILLIIINYQVSNALEKELIERGNAIGTGMARISAPKILEEDVVELKHIITDALSFESVEYVLILDYNRGYLTDTFNGNIPEALKKRIIPDEVPENSQFVESVNYDGSACYDIAIPVEDGDIGFIRVGMRKGYISQKIASTNNFIVFSIIIVTLLGILVTYFLSNRIIRPILYLTNRANEISTGKLEEKINVLTNDETKNLADAVERLRESLNLALARLKKHQTSRI